MRSVDEAIAFCLRQGDRQGIGGEVGYSEKGLLPAEALYGKNPIVEAEDLRPGRRMKGGLPCSKAHQVEIGEEDPRPKTLRIGQLRDKRIGYEFLPVDRSGPSSLPNPFGPVARSQEAVDVNGRNTGQDQRHRLGGQKARDKKRIVGLSGISERIHIGDVELVRTLRAVRVPFHGHLAAVPPNDISQP